MQAAVASLIGVCGRYSEYLGTPPKTSQLAKVGQLLLATMIFPLLYKGEIPLLCSINLALATLTTLISNTNVTNMSKVYLFV